MAVWGGGQKQTLIKDNLFAILPNGSNAVAVLGLGHMSLKNGYVVRLDRDISGRWKAFHIGQLPAHPQGLRQLRHRLYVVWSIGRAIVFSPDGILGLASCER